MIAARTCALRQRATQRQEHQQRDKQHFPSFFVNDEYCSVRAKNGTAKRKELILFEMMMMIMMMIMMMMMMMVVNTHCKNYERFVDNNLRSCW